jgi:hypothetical protein
MTLSRLRFSLGFPSGPVFPGEELLRSFFSAEAAPVELGVRRGMIRRSSRTTLEQFAPRKPVFPHMISCFEISPRKILLLEEILG